MKLVCSVKERSDQSRYAWKEWNSFYLSFVRIRVFTRTFKLRYLVCALSPVNHKGLHQGKWTKGANALATLTQRANQSMTINILSTTTIGVDYYFRSVYIPSVVTKFHAGVEDVLHSCSFVLLMHVCVCRVCYNIRATRKVFTFEDYFQVETKLFKAQKKVQFTVYDRH